jgi:hypothetical protein
MAVPVITTPQHTDAATWRRIAAKARRWFTSRAV